MSTEHDYELIEIVCPTLGELLQEINDLKGILVWCIEKKDCVQAAVKIRRKFED